MISGSGRCLCGAVRYKFDPNGVLWQLHCHCESCRRATSSPFTTFIAVRNTALRWTGADRARHESSPGVTRSFCPTCGAPMAYENAGKPGETHIYAASLDAPADAAPEGHDFWSEKLPWIHLSDDLPKHSDAESTTPIEPRRAEA